MENWRSYLQEKKWSDYEIPKGEWAKLSADDIRKAALDKDGEITIADELYALIDRAYAKIGGHFDFKSSSDVPGKYSDWLAVDLDDDPEPDVVRVSNKKGVGQKMAAAGHDGTKKAIDAYLAKTAELLKTDGFYGEMSKAIAHIMITRHNVPYVSSHEDVERVLGKKVEWVGQHPEGKYPDHSGWYERDIGGKHRDMKIMVGRPNGIQSVVQP